MATPEKPRRVRDGKPKLFWHEARETFYVIYRHARTGKRVWVPTGTADPAKAEDALERHTKLLGAEDLGLTRVLSPAERALTVGDCVDLVVAFYTRERRRALPSIHSDSKRAKAVLGRVRVEGLTLRVVNEARDALIAHGYTPGTVNRTMAVVRFGLSRALAEERLERLPGFVTGQDWPRFNEEEFVREGFVTEEELAAVNRAELYDAARDFNTWAHWTGMRFGEIQSLAWANFDAATWTLRLSGRKSKSKKGRVLPIGPGPLRDILTRRLADRRAGCPLVFHVEGRRIDRERWERAWIRAKLPMRTTSKGHPAPVKIFHDLRRTAVRNAVLAGNQERDAMLLSGHRTRTVFDRYNIAEEADAAAALARITAFHAARAAAAAAQNPS